MLRTKCRYGVSPLLLLWLVAGANFARAQAYNVLYSFDCQAGDGNGPVGGLVADPAGNLYGTTEIGGGHDGGIAFEVTPGGAETILHSFAGSPSDGQNPQGTLLRSADGVLYGTTYTGGLYGFGTVFKIDSDSDETTLYNFTGGSDGSSPYAGVVEDQAGNLYGTTIYGGLFGAGVAFELSANGKESVLHNFGEDGQDGVYPYGQLLRDERGDLYGTAKFGGPYGVGIAFEIFASGGEKLLRQFAGGPTDGAEPETGLVLGNAGNLYGTTVQGGTGDYFDTVFELTPEGTETILFNFDGLDGGEPYGSIVRDTSGAIYGTGYGAVLEITTRGTVSTRYYF